jgi:DNA-binding NarL/FixJ family response regulator
MPSWACMALRCLIVDDNAGFAEAAASLLEGQGLTVVGVATSTAETETKIAELRPDVVLVDVHLGDESGFDVAGAIAAGGGPPVILISTHDEQELLDRIEASPAAGFVPKTELSAERIAALA